MMPQGITSNLSTWEAEAGGLWVWGQPKLHTETQSQKIIKVKKKNPMGFRILSYVD
jgi:hypothetical protein